MIFFIVYVYNIYFYIILYSVSYIIADHYIIFKEILLNKFVLFTEFIKYWIRSLNNKYNIVFYTNILNTAYNNWISKRGTLLRSL